MYERFYRLRERPFALTPDPDYLYPSRVHKEALSYLRYGIESHAGFVVITGAIGSGKTTLLQTMLRGLDSQTTVARVMNTLLDPRELLESAMIDLGLDPDGKSKPAMLKAFGEFLVNERAAGRLVLLVIDEAQNLTLPALEEIRMLSNLETEKSKLLQIILIGQPDLRDKLDRPELEQLRQRITVSYHLEALDADETVDVHQPSPGARLGRRAAGIPARRHRSDSRAQRRRAAPDQRHLRRDAGVRLRRGAQRDRRGADRRGHRRSRRDRRARAAVERRTATTRSCPRIRRWRQPPTAKAPRGRLQPSPPRRPARPTAEDEKLKRELAELERDLKKREQDMASRERELAEQRRVLADQYRLLKAQSQPAAAAPSAAPPPGRRPPRRRRPRTAVNDPDRPDCAETVRRRRRFSPRINTNAAAPSLWRRVKNTLLGIPEPVLEDSL